MDSTCILIGQQVCFHSALNHKSMVGCLQVVRIYNFMKEIKYSFTLRKSFFCFLGRKIIILWKKLINHVLRAFITWWKSRQSLLESTASRVFTDLLSNSTKRSPRVSPDNKSTENMFYFLTDDFIDRKGFPTLCNIFYFFKNYLN